MRCALVRGVLTPRPEVREGRHAVPDRKSTRLNSSHSQISYAVFCLKKKMRHLKDPHEIVLAVRDAQPPPAPAGGGLAEHGTAHVPADLLRFVETAHGPHRARQHRAV